MINCHEITNHIILLYVPFSVIYFFFSFWDEMRLGSIFKKVRKEMGRCLQSQAGSSNRQQLIAEESRACFCTTSTSLDLC